MKGTLVIFLAIFMFVELALVYYVREEFESNRIELIKSQRKGCERSKLDRVDNAKFQKAHKTYIQKVTGAKSVQEDVKKAAREARKVFVRTSRSLTHRAKINCVEAFP